MQTFLPFKSFGDSARILDQKRLGNQRGEAIGALYLCGINKGVDFQTLLKLTDDSCERLWRRFRFHPVIRMWQDHMIWLCIYGMIICNEWTNRGFKDSCRERFVAVVDYLKLTDMSDLPPWLGNTKFHLSHQSNLVRKNPDYYSKLFPFVDGKLRYFWPV